MNPSPCVEAVRAVNQYRRRDVLTYLALRYYLENLASRTSQWAREVSTELVLSRTSFSYHTSLHFKELDAAGAVEHRAVHLPAANEALAEATLLSECASHPGSFGNPDCAYSYELSAGKDTRGVFRPYFGGLRRRHERIAQACDERPSGVVHYTDIKRFYPSIESSLARAVWEKACTTCGMDGDLSLLGGRLLDDYSQHIGEGVPTGPMFSHLLGNLVLREIDLSSMKELPADYFRYVDDIVLVGSEREVERSLRILRRRLADKGLKLHESSSAKSLRLSCKEWLVGRHDYQDSRSDLSWMVLIGRLKQFLVARPERVAELRAAMKEQDVRLPVLDYKGVTREAQYLERFLAWSGWSWFRRKVKNLSVQEIVALALRLRSRYETELVGLAEQASRAHGFELKRLVPKIRYRASRLVYLSTRGQLTVLAQRIEALRELYFHSTIMKAVGGGRVGQVLELGSNAAQAVGQALRAAGLPAVLEQRGDGMAWMQGQTALRLYGVDVVGEVLSDESSELLRFANIGSDRGLRQSPDPYLRELACLHGESKDVRHPLILESAFDEDEDLALDAIDMMQDSFAS